MRTAALLLLLAAVAANTDTTNTDDTSVNRTHDALTDRFTANDTSFNANETLTDESDGEHEPVVRKKRTFGDIVFRGLADVLGYNVARKPPQAAFPPPLAPVPGIDTPLQAAPTAAPVTAAPAVAAPAPCGAARAAAAPPPCRAQRPPAPKPKAAPPCPKPRAAPKPKPSPPPPPPPPPPPCAKPRANPTTPSPCTPTPPPPPPPKQEAESNLETISSNFQLNFNFNRKPATAAPVAEQAAADDGDEAEAEAESDQEQAAPIAPIAIEPRAAKLPPSEPRKPRVYVDAFVVRNGVAQKVDTVDANQFDPQRAADEDYLSYDDGNEQAQYDDYEDAQESRDRTKSVHEFDTAVDQFWQKKRQQRRLQPQKLPSNHYKNVHFGDRDLGQVQLQSLQQERPRANRIPLPLPALPVLPEHEEDAEATTTTEDPKRPLRPRVLPPTEHNPNEIDTVTVRVPPIYKAKRPKKHRELPVEGETDSTEAEDGAEFDARRQEGESDTEGDDSWVTPYTERPIKRKRRRRRKQNRSKRSTDESIEYAAGNYDYYGKKLPVSKEELYYMQLTVPTPTKDADLERHEAPSDEHALDEHERLKDDSERLKEDPERLKDSERSREDDETDKGSDEDSGKADSHERADSHEKTVKDTERTGDKGRADSLERTDKLSPSARVHETGYQNNYVHATNVLVDDRNPQVTTVDSDTVTTGSP